ncbi:PDX1 C-terminal inhibiting factor 1 [Aureococcus anophagefferens]|nr:PDX1 C-terminal inhibiting factor 1 [Aureococcus anophagefferens]
MALLGSSLFVQASARPAAAAGARLARGAVPDARCAGVRRHVADGLAGEPRRAASRARARGLRRRARVLVAAATASAPPERWTDATFDVARRTLAGGRARYVERPSRFCSRCLVVARTYEATLADAGQHGQLPAAAFGALRAWGCDFELFASPLNATLPRYCSLHASDVPFGSSGSFFDFDLAAGGNFEANPPFCLPAGAYFDVFERALDAAGDAVALSIALVVPETTDAKDRAAALRARGLVAANVRVPKGHAYRRGRSHEGAGPWTCPFGTYVTVLQTRAARLRWPAADLADRLYESFFADGGAPAPPRADRVFLYEARDDLDDASRTRRAAAPHAGRTPPAATPPAPPRTRAPSAGRRARESALSFGALWAKQYFGARAENALIEGAVVRVEGNSVVCAWKFPDQDEPGEFPMKLARAALLARLAADARRCAAAPEAQGQKRRRELTTLSDLRTRAKKKRGKRRVADESDSDGEDDDGTFRYTFATPDAPGSRPRDVAPAADATLEAALAALEASEIPVQDSRTNVTRPGAPAPRGLVLGAVNARATAACASRRDARAAALAALCDVFRAHAPDPAFRFTTIQINCNYEAALHVDKFNLGPSYIVGVGDYGPPEDPKLPAEFAGRLWVQGRGALDVREQFVLFDGNAPHSTIPFAGARYTLIFFTPQYALPEGERAYCDALGFPCPTRSSASRPTCARPRSGSWRAATRRRAAATFVTGDREGEAADEARCRADVVADDLVAEALAHRKPFGRVERWEAACANRRDEAGGARLLAKYAGLCLLDDDPYDAHSDVASLGRRLSDSVGQEAFKRTELARAIAAGAAQNTIEKYPLDKALVDYILKSPHNPDIKPPKKPPHKPAAQKPAPGPAAEARRAAPPPPRPCPHAASPPAPAPAAAAAAAYAVGDVVSQADRPDLPSPSRWRWRRLRLRLRRRSRASGGGTRSRSPRRTSCASARASARGAARPRRPPRPLRRARDWRSGRARAAARPSARGPGAPASPRPGGRPRAAALTPTKPGDGGGAPAAAVAPVTPAPGADARHRRARRRLVGEAGPGDGPVLPRPRDHGRVPVGAARHPSDESDDDEVEVALPDERPRWRSDADGAA